MAGRGRKAGPVAAVMDTTARAMELPVWDQAEAILIGSAAQQVRQMMDYYQHDPELIKRCRHILKNLADWWQGDCAENQKHQDILTGLRNLAGLMDSSEDKQWDL